MQLLLERCCVSDVTDDPQQRRGPLCREANECLRSRQSRGSFIASDGSQPSRKWGCTLVAAESTADAVG